MKIGNANYSGNYKKKNKYKQQEGDVIFRIIPPLGSLADEGRWSNYWEVQWGYKNTKGHHKPFQSSLVVNKKTKMVEVPDAASERIEKGKAQLEEAKKSGNTELTEKLNKFFGQKGQYNTAKGHHMNVVDQQGNIGTLEIRHKCKKLLDQEIKRLQAEGVDPLSVDNGRFFVFNRTGMGNDTSFKVSVLQADTIINGKKYKEDVVHVLTSDLRARLGSEAEDLAFLFPRPTHEEIARLVKEGATAVDEIFPENSSSAKSSESKVQSTAAVEPPKEDDDSPGEDYVEPKSMPVSTPATAAPAAASPVEEVKSQPAKTETPPKTTPAMQQSDADFLASLM